MDDMTYCITRGCMLKDNCERSREFEPGSFKSYGMFYFYIVDGMTVCNYFIEKENKHDRRAEFDKFYKELDRFEERSKLHNFICK